MCRFNTNSIYTHNNSHNSNHTHKHTYIHHIHTDNATILDKHTTCIHNPTLKTYCLANTGPNNELFHVNVCGLLPPLETSPVTWAFPLHTFTLDVQQAFHPQTQPKSWRHSKTLFFLPRSDTCAKACNHYHSLLCRYTCRYETHACLFKMTREDAVPVSCSPSSTFWWATDEAAT